MFSFSQTRSRDFIAGALAVGVCVAVSNIQIVRAEIATGMNKIFSCSSGTACVEGKATGTNSFGVYGNSAAGTGVQGNSTATNSNSGVAGVNSGTTGNGYGVYGRSSNGPGMYGTSATHDAIVGVTTCTSAACDGVHGTSTTNYGVEGDFNAYSEFTNGSGVYGSAVGGNGNGVYGTADFGFGVLARSSSSEGPGPFEAFNTNGSMCTIDTSADLFCSGKVSGGKDAQTVHRTANGVRVLAYASQSASETIDDVGTGQLAGGSANVALDPTFASTIDRSRPYHVFLTPLGDTRGLYVSAKTPAGFVVRETQGGRSNLEFDYRIVARPLDAGNERLPIAPPAKRPAMARDRR